MGVSYNQIVNITPGVLSAGGSALDLSGLFLTQSQYAPLGQVLSFPNQTSVSNYFGGTSLEAQYATNYFSAYDNSFSKPGALLFTRYPETAIAGFLRSGSMANVTLATLKTFTGTIAITVAGTLFTSSTINLSTATSFSAAATLIQAGFTAPTFAVTYDSTVNAFIFTTNTTGATQTITYGDSGTLSTNLMLTQATGAALSQGAAAGVPGAFMTSTLPVNSNWASFGTLWESNLTEKQAFATWVSGQNNRFAYVVQDSDPNALVTGSTSTFMYWVSQNTIAGVVPIAGTVSPAHVAAVMGYAAALNFSRLNGRTTLFGRTQSGLAPTITTDTAYSNALANGYNVYSQFSTDNPANNKNLFSNGTVSGQFQWADSYFNQIWLNANMQIALVNLLSQSNSIPYNQFGYGLVKSALLVPIASAVKFGLIRKGVQPSAAQVAQMTAILGVDPSKSLFNSGFYLQVSDPGAVVRQGRGSPVVTLYYMDGESIQKISMASINVL